LLQIELIGKLPSFNEYQYACRSHWRKGAKFKEEVESDIIAQLLPHRFVRYQKKVRLHYLWVETSARRDNDNIVSAQKFVQDALIKVGILRGDGQKWLAVSQHEVIKGDKAKVVITFEELDV